MIQECRLCGSKDLTLWMRDGRNSDLVMLGPPLTTTREQADEMVGILETAVAQELRQ